MSVVERIVGDRRQQVLTSLNEMANHMLNEDVILRAVIMTGREIDHDILRDDLTFLQARGCVRIEKLPRGNGDDLWKVVLTDMGHRVVYGEQTVNGVARATVN